jgi:ribonuclease D
VQPGELDFAPIPAPSSPQQRRLLGNLKHAANAIAARLDLPEGLLCARRHLDALVTTGAWPAALEGWRKPLLHDALMERIHA